MCAVKPLKKDTWFCPILIFRIKDTLSWPLIQRFHCIQESATEQFLKDLMVQREQKTMEKGGEKAGVGRFQQAGLDENKSLHMKTPTTTGLPFFTFPQ